MVDQAPEAGQQGSSPKHASGWRILRRVLQELRGFRLQLIMIALLGVVVAPLGLLQPLALKITVDNYLREDPLPSVVEPFVPSGLTEMDGRMGYLLLAVALVIFAAVVTQALSYCKRLLRTHTKERLVLGFRVRLFGHVERLSLSYHDEQGPTDSTFRIMMDTAVIPGVLMEGIIPSIQALALLVVVTVVALTLSMKLALIGLAVAPLLLLASWPFGRSLRRQWHNIKELDTSVMGRLQEVFSAVRVIKSFGKEQGETDRLFKLAEKGVAARMQVAVTQGKFAALTRIGAALGMAAFLLFGAQMVKNGQMALGDLIMVAALMVQFFAPLQLLVGQVASMQSSLASAERVLNLLDQAPEVIERSDARTLERAEGVVAFKNTTFGYEKGQVVINDLSFDVPSGFRIGIAGTTGAGKTTLMNLLTRLYDPDAGAVFLDGIDLRDIKVDDLRKQFAVVLQEPVLFKKSISENINYALPGATIEQTMEAARLANAHDFIMEMPDGYDTVVGDRGQRLSGGERQRISLARAFLKDAPILILDEPTSSVDMRTEAVIMEALQRLMKGRTTFIIAHRPSTLKICDKVLVIEKGKKVAYASPDSVRSLDELMLATADTRAQESDPATPAGGDS